MRYPITTVKVHRDEIMDTGGTRARHRIETVIDDVDCQFSISGRQ